MKLVIDIPEDEYNECKMQVEMIKQEGFLVESLNTALKIHIANGRQLEEKPLRENVRGEWQWLASTYDRIPCESRFLCSECHHETITFEREPWERFCPNCGAEMRGKCEVDAK